MWAGHTARSNKNLLIEQNNQKPILINIGSGLFVVDYVTVYLGHEEGRYCFSQPVEMVPDLQECKAGHSRTSDIPLFLWRVLVCIAHPAIYLQSIWTG